jgi:CheY-like chemotaxis protein
MSDPEQAAWIKSTANDLNNLLQVISESAKVLESLIGDTAERRKYFAILNSSVERASQTTRSMVDRVGGYSVESTLMQKPAATPLPAIPATGPLVPPLGADLRIHNPAGTRELLLIVDDEDFVTMLAERVLAQEGYRIITAKDGFQAIEIYRKLRDQIALVILDFTMPVMDGADVFEELRMINPKVPVVLSSGFTEHERLRSMLANGLRGFIPKPYTHEKLLTQVRSTLDALKAEQTGERRVL